RLAPRSRSPDRRTSFQACRVLPSVRLSGNLTALAKEGVVDRTCARRRLFGVLLGIGLVGLLLFPAGAAAGRTPKGGAILQVNTYRVDGVSTKEDRSAIERTGTSIEIVGSNYVLVRATGPEISKVLALGYHVSGYVEPNNFPGDDAKYHNYREMAKDIAAEVAAHPGII